MLMRKRFFFEKKNQKTFFKVNSLLWQNDRHCDPGVKPGEAIQAAFRKWGVAGFTTAQSIKKFFCFFLFTKRSAFCPA
jgi:hypothetical protein